MAWRLAFELDSSSSNIHQYEQYNIIVMSLLSRLPRQSFLFRPHKAHLVTTRNMASVNDLPQPYLTHLQRTADQKRGSDVHAVTLSKITPAAGGSIHLLHLDIDRAEGIKVRHSLSSAILSLKTQLIQTHHPNKRSSVQQ